VSLVGTLPALSIRSLFSYSSGALVGVCGWSTY